MEDDFCSISLYFYGDNISHDDVSRLLGLAPTRVRSRGDVRVTSSGAQVVQKIGLWECRTRVKRTEIASGIAHMIGNIERSVSVVGVAGIEKAELDLFLPMDIGTDQGGFSFELPTVLLATISVLGIDVVVTAR